MPGKRVKTYVLGEALTWRVLLRRCRTSRNRWLACKNLSLHITRAVIVRVLSFNVRIGERLIPAHSLAREAYIQAKIAVSVPIGLFHSPHQVVEQWIAPDRPLGEKVALFVHFDATGEVAPAARDFIASLAQAGLDVVFVTNSERILDEGPRFSRAPLRRRPDPPEHRLRFRRLAGRARHARPAPGAETRAIFLVNDSVYGPFADLKPLLAAHRL